MNEVAKYFSHMEALIHAVEQYWSETIPIIQFYRQLEIPSVVLFILKIQIDDKVYVLVNIYAPNKDKDLIQFFRKLHGLLQMEDLDSEENIILGGDFNCPLNPALDKHGRGCLKNNQYLVLKGFLSTERLL